VDVAALLHVMLSVPVRVDPPFFIVLTFTADELAEPVNVPDVGVPLAPEHFVNFPAAKTTVCLTGFPFDFRPGVACDFTVPLQENGAIVCAPADAGPFGITKTDRGPASTTAANDIAVTRGRKAICIIVAFLSCAEVFSTRKGWGSLVSTEVVSSYSRPSSASEHPFVMRPTPGRCYIRPLREAPRVVLRRLISWR
jgi:hypothetical protein